jgi:glycosyltransferase involved in cell wall biosynthesis
LARKAVVIPNGVDVAAVCAQAEQPAAGFDYNGPVALAVGRLVAQKNFGTLLEAVAIARRSIDLNLLLIGAGPLKAELEESARGLGLGDAFRIIDPVSNPFPLFRQADVIVLPSWWEGSSNVLLEALACGTPVVASRTAGSAEEVLDEGRYGLLVDPSDAQALADAIIRQVGPDALGPQDRAADYDRSKSLDAYADLIAGLDAR